MITKIKNRGLKKYIHDHHELKSEIKTRDDLETNLFFIDRNSDNGYEFESYTYYEKEERDHDHAIIKELFKL